MIEVYVWMPRGSSDGFDIINPRKDTGHVSILINGKGISDYISFWPEKDAIDAYRQAMDRKKRIEENGKAPIFEEQYIFKLSMLSVPRLLINNVPSIFVPSYSCDEFLMGKPATDIIYLYNLREDLMVNFIKTYILKGDKYNLINHNCSSVVMSILKEGNPDLNEKWDNNIIEKIGKPAFLTALALASIKVNNKGFFYRLFQGNFNINDISLRIVSLIGKQTPDNVREFAEYLKREVG